MRKVAPGNERFIDEKLIKTRLEFWNKRQIQPGTTKEFLKLHTLLENGEGKDPELLVKKVYAFVDRYMAKEVYPWAACAKGCGHCCKVPVSLTFLEAAYIHELHGVELTNPKASFKDGKPIIGYCPFFDHDNAVCAVYEARPLNCRTFASMDHWKECEKDNNPHQIHTLESNKMLQILSEWFAKQTLINGFSAADIRQFFKGNNEN